MDRGEHSIRGSTWLRPGCGRCQVWPGGSLGSGPGIWLKRVFSSIDAAHPGPRDGGGSLGMMVPGGGDPEVGPWGPAR